MENFIFISVRERIFKINLFDIMYIHAEGSYSIIHLVNNEVIKISRNMKHLLSRIHETDFLVKVHRSWVVNVHMLDSIKSVKGYGSHILTLKGGIEIPIVPKEKKNLLQKYAYKF